jgi:hypothetical protein
VFGLFGFKTSSETTKELGIVRNIQREVCHPPRGSNSKSGGGAEKQEFEGGQEKWLITNKGEEIIVEFTNESNLLVDNFNESDKWA